MADSKILVFYVVPDRREKKFMRHAHSFTFFLPKLTPLNDWTTFGKFTVGISDCLSQVETDYKAEHGTSMQPNFQNLKNVMRLAG